MPSATRGLFLRKPPLGSLQKLLFNGKISSRNFVSQILIVVECIINGCKQQTTKNFRCLISPNLLFA